MFQYPAMKAPTLLFGNCSWCYHAMVDYTHPCSAVGPGVCPGWVTNREPTATTEVTVATPKTKNQTTTRCLSV